MSKSIETGVAICFAYFKVAWNKRKKWVFAPSHYWCCETDNNDIAPGSVQLFKAQNGFDPAYKRGVGDRRRPFLAVHGSH